MTKPNQTEKRKQSPSGIAWEETRASLMKRFPKVWERYGWEETLEQSINTDAPAKPWWKFWWTLATFEMALALDCLQATQSQIRTPR